jgi:hypothetical protein
MQTLWKSRAVLLILLVGLWLEVISKVKRGII